MQEKIENVLDKIRPYLQSDGGDIEFVKFDDGVCYLKFLGHCSTCPMMLMTLNDLVKDSLINEIDEIVDVKLITE
ncbi:MAG: NifU family protein [Bacilli bacterium]|nr:NifU family protein [Bacilli bacterium]